MDSNTASYDYDDVELWFGSALVGHAVQVYCSDDTWFGDFKPEAAERFESDPTLKRLYEFINFCIDWNDRNDRDQDNPPDADEFDSFSDIIHSSKWFARTPQGETLLIEHAPVFHPEGWLSWRPP